MRSREPDRVGERETAIGLRPMTRADIPLGMRLKSEAGWNQEVDDWRLLLDAGMGWVATFAGVEVGTATVLPYDAAFSWIGMVLVDPAYRRRGVGTALLRKAVAAAQVYGTPRLDATPRGVPLYEGLGFQIETGITRMVRPAEATLEVGRALTDAPAVHPLAPADFSEVADLDRPIFGADRRRVLAALLRRNPRYAFIWAEADEIHGYCLGRSGSHHDQIGPVVAASTLAAQALVAAALRACVGRSVIIDALDDRPDWQAWLGAIGFVTSRPFTRMSYDTAHSFGDAAQQYAIAGPELG